MIRFMSLLAVVVGALALMAGGEAGIFAGVLLLLVGVAGFGLFVALCTEVMREH